jgi:hypothetical protein
MIDTGMVSSFLRFAAIQSIECIQNPAGLAPKSCFIAAQAIEREVGQIGETYPPPTDATHNSRRTPTSTHLGSHHHRNDCYKER